MRFPPEKRRLIGACGGKIKRTTKFEMKSLYLARDEVTKAIDEMEQPAGANFRRSFAANFVSGWLHNFKKGTT